MSNNSLMFAPMSVRLAAQGERDRRERAEQLEAERIEREAAQAREKSREQSDAEFGQMLQASAVTAIAKVDYGTQAALDRQAAEKAEHIADIKLLGAVVASELKPVLADLVTEIRALITQLKDGQPAQKDKEL
jgi:hypothetical protein